MVRYKFVYWCTSHQQFVDQEARRRNRRRFQHCKIIRLNMTLLRQVDLHAFSTWITSQHSSVYHAEKPRQSLRLARRMRWIGA